LAEDQGAEESMNTKYEKFGHANNIDSIQNLGISRLDLTEHGKHARAESQMNQYGPTLRHVSVLGYETLPGQTTLLNSGSDPKIQVDASHQEPTGQSGDRGDLVNQPDPGKAQQDYRFSQE